MEGSKLTHDQTRYIFETNTIGMENEVFNVDDIIETANHFRCIDLIIDNAKVTLTEKFIKNIHLILKNGTSDSRKDWFAVGNYKRVPNEVGGMATASPEEVSTKMKVLLGEYARKNEITFEDILDFHVKFERIHPFQDGNGRVGRLLMFKECLKHNIVPFIIEDDLKMFYYRGLKEWNREKGYLMDTCLTAQDRYKAYLDYFSCVYIEFVSSNCYCFSVSLKQFDHFVNKSAATLLNILTCSILVNFTDDNLSICISYNIFDRIVHVFSCNRTSLCVVCTNFASDRSFRSICDTCIKCYNRDSFVSTCLQCIQNRRCIACCNTDSFRVGSDCCVDHVNLVSLVQQVTLMHLIMRKMVLQ